LTTNDGFPIQGTYFAGGFVQKSEKEIVAKSGKEVVPVILLHGFEGNRRELEPLAVVLQQQGHAVVTIDLRGHGDSNKFSLPDGTVREVSPDKLKASDLASMSRDVEAAKSFLLDKNNAGLVNLELLCLVGADLGATVAVNWIAADWSRRDLPAFKQGKYAKAVALLSPPSSVKGYSAAIAWKHAIFQSPGFSLLLVTGKRDGKSMSELKQINNRLEKAHPKPATEQEQVEKQSLFFFDPDTELTGTKLVDPRARLPVIAWIVQFIQLRLVNKQSEYPWGERKNPLGD
jgi:pimeloyl-ACP methyl ester carboxylesterase